MYTLEMFINDISFVKNKLNDLTKALDCIKIKEQEFLPIQFVEDYSGPYMLEAIESVIVDLINLENRAKAKI